MHTILSYHGNRPTTNTHTNPQTGPITIHCTAASYSSLFVNNRQIYYLCQGGGGNTGKSIFNLQFYKNYYPIIEITTKTLQVNEHTML